MKKFLSIFLAVCGLAIFSSELLAESVSVQMRVGNSSMNSVKRYSKSINAIANTPHVSVIIVDNVAPNEVKPLTSFLLNKLRKQYGLRKKAEAFRVNKAMLVRKTKQRPNGDDKLVVLSPQNENKFRSINRSADRYLQEYNRIKGTNYVSTFSTSPRMYAPHISIGRPNRCDQRGALNRVRALNNSIASGALRRSKSIALNRFEATIKYPNGKVTTLSGKPSQLRKPAQRPKKSFRKNKKGNFAKSNINSQKRKGFARNRPVQRRYKAPGAARGRRVVLQNKSPRKNKRRFFFFK